MAWSPGHFRENLGKPLPESPDFGRESRRYATKSGRSRSTERAAMPLRGTPIQERETFRATRRIILQPSACAWSKIPSPRDGASWPKRMRTRSHHDRRPYLRLPVCLVRSAVCLVRSAACLVRSRPVCPVRNTVCLVRSLRVPGPKSSRVPGPQAVCAWSQEIVCLVRKKCVPGPKKSCAWSEIAIF
jgi:hypothetical protein